MKIDRYRTFESDNPLNDSEQARGMLVYVYRGKHSAAAGGITEKFDTLVLIGPGIPGISSATPQKPAIYIKEGYRGRVYASPVPGKEQDDDGAYSFSGNFVYSSDSSFSKLNNGHPIPVHDRFESWDFIKSMD